MELNTLLENKKHNSLEKFAESLLSKMKRNTSFSVTFDDGYIMGGYQSYVINDNFYTKKEAVEFIIDECIKIQNRYYKK